MQLYFESKPPAGRLSEHPRYSPVSDSHRVWRFGLSNFTEDSYNVAEATLHRGRFSYRNNGKRILDLAMVAIAAPIVLTAILIICGLVRLDGGPAFFGHRRVGRNGKDFYCWKVRTMVVDAEAKLDQYLKDHPELKEEWQRNFKLKHDPRVTRIGNFLRRTSLDELPQFWNVVRGDMSFVGPRPVIRPELDHYGEAAGPCFAVRPGMTGLWQVSGRNVLEYSERVSLDMSYVQDVRLMKDMGILLRTAGAVLKRTGL
ncbi:sugar transferase (plasmid) [Paracoccus liaowanqingii]|uniref:Sugar transferase n=1 Tax=Paracoccus liaowanqingii TaxID=2560053 RepID=A0A4Y5SVH4_9RHOB|nr:sugar transferase [Paracoccus liaowanqingii]QDA36786.1 sugar transferase [Paracoccus liaowanqingii]